jgi:predicted transposase YbfD/YdcC
MSSSPIPLLSSQARQRLADGALLEVLAGVPDPRARRGLRHPLVGLLAVSVCAVLAGARSFAAIADWAGELTCPDLATLGLTRPEPPQESTLRRVLSRLDAGELDSLVGAFLWTRSRVAEGRRVIAIDGKTSRGARTRTDPAPHLVSAMDHATGAVLGQLAVAAKSNEIPAVRTLLATFDLTGVVVTVDAMHTQTDTATAIVDAGGDYVFTVKGNQPTLYAACKALPWSHVPAHSTTQRGHGRRVTRTIKVVQAPAWVSFAGARQVAQIRRTTTRNGKKSVEVVYVITSADALAAPPATLAAWVQGHWGIENRCHWVRDVTYDEDRSRARTGHAAQVMACLRNTAISLHRLAGRVSIAAALRHHAARPDRPINTVLTS